MTGADVSLGLPVAAVLFCIGLAGVLIRRNALVVLMSVEVMLNAGGLAFITAGARWGSVDGQVMMLFVLAVAAAEVSVGLALVLRIRSRIRSLDIDQLSRMRG